jgi:hypothetical protein
MGGNNNEANADSTRGVTEHASAGGVHHLQAVSHRSSERRLQRSSIGRNLAPNRYQCGVDRPCIALKGGHADMAKDG